MSVEWLSVECNVNVLCGIENVFDKKENIHKIYIRLACSLC